MATARLQVKLDKNGVPVLKGMTVPPPDNTEVHQYIVNKSNELGIDPKVSLEVWAREGKAGWQSNFVKNGKRERSYGPYQLYVDGGLGNKFQEQTGLDPSDPKNWKQGVDFALQQAKSGGWGPWYGAKAAGITGFEGIGGVPAAFVPGGSYSPAAAQAGKTVSEQIKPFEYKWGGTSEAVQPSNARQMATFGKFNPMTMGAPQRAGSQAEMDPAIGDLTGMAEPIAGLVEEFAAPSERTQMAGDVVNFPIQMPQGWTPQEVRQIANEYGVDMQTVIKMIQAQTGTMGPK
jgi:hypothetical protein